MRRLWRERAKKSLLGDFGCVAVFGQLWLYKSELGIKKGFLDPRFRVADGFAVVRILVISSVSHLFVSIFEGTIPHTNYSLKETIAYLSGLSFDFATSLTCSIVELRSTFSGSVGAALEVN